MAQNQGRTEHEILPIPDISVRCKINWVRIDLEEDNVSHLESDELNYHRVLARQ